MNSGNKKNYDPDNFQRNVDGYFNKKFKFTSDSSWILPEQIYTSEKWAIPQFQENKCLLNSVKEQLSKYDLDEWSKYTKNRDPSSSIIRTIRSKYKVELLTQAWCKFYECASQYDVIPKISIDTNYLYSVHLCEAPGAFICALNHFLAIHHPNIKWRWSATTLNPNYEGNPLTQMIPDDRLIQHTLENWNFGCDYTGDITKYYNHLSLVDSFIRNGKPHLVTADGSIDCMMNPGDQERSVEFLHYCEIVTALNILELAGTLVIKIFTTFEESSICLMYLLNCCFDQVHIFKPCTSKSGNSEVYVICLNYRGVKAETLQSLRKLYVTPNFEGSMFRLEDISETFVKQLLRCSVFFMERQIYTINENIKYFKQKCCYESERIKYIKNLIVERFLTNCSISDIFNKSKIVKHVNISSYSNYQKDLVDRAVAKVDVDRIISKLDLNQILDIKIGKYLFTIHHSKFGPINGFPFKNSQSSGLYRMASTHLNDQNNIISAFDFNFNSDVGSFHRTFFLNVKEKVQPDKNLIITRVPLVSSFLVGLVFLAMFGFKTIWFINGTIVLEHPNCDKIAFVKRCMEQIDILYETLNKDSKHEYKKDILELVSMNSLKCNDFLQYIWNYNCNVMEL